MNSVVLFSGGLDSTTLIALALSKNETVFPLTILYGQRHKIEIEKSKKILKKYGLTDRASELEINLSFLTNCSLINSDIAVPDGDDSKKEIPNTYVPSRNIIFLSFAASYAESVDAQKIYIGVNSVDYSGYPDCRPEFIEAFNSAVAKGTKQGIEKGLRIEAPLVNLSKKEIILLGTSLGVDYSMTHSCYDPEESGRACGRCDSCRLRLKGFVDAGLKDLAEYKD